MRKRAMQQEAGYARHSDIIRSGIILTRVFKFLVRGSQHNLLILLTIRSSSLHSIKYPVGIL
jgi:hypothetical protein